MYLMPLQPDNCQTQRRQSQLLNPAAAEPAMAKPDVTQPAAANPRHQPQPNPKQSTSRAKRQHTNLEDAKP